MCNNYTTLEATWNEALDVATQSEVKSRINGVASKRREFDFFLVSCRLSKF